MRAKVQYMTKSALAAAFRWHASWPAWLLGSLLAAYTVGLVLKGDADNEVFENVAATLTRWVPAIICWLALVRVDRRRGEMFLATAGITVNAVADSYFYFVVHNSGAQPFPSPADAGYLVFYTLMLGALGVLVHRQLRGLSRTVLLDCAVGASGTATLLVVMLGPLAESATNGPETLGGTIVTAYAVLDILLAATLAGLATSRGLFVGRRWMLLVTGLGVFTGADIVYFLTDSGALSLPRAPLEIAWAGGLALIALWVHASARPEGSRSRTPLAGSALLMPGLATAAGLAVLIVGTRTHVSTLAVVLAALTMTLATVPLAFRQRVLRHQARTDELTGLPNRRALYSESTVRLASARRTGTALLLMDLDRFKEVNDSLGHDVGDRLLIQVGLRLTRQLGPGDMLARLGGDEFAVLLATADQDDAIVTAIVLRAAIAETFMLEGIVLHTNMSIGIACYPDQGEDLGGLLRKADMAMYKAKSSRAGYHVYTSADDSDFGTRLRTLHELRVALKTDQLVLYYQPKLELATGEIRSVEALVRWNHPCRGLLQPGDFLPLVEEAGLMHEMTHVLLAQALDQAAVWMLREIRLSISVNLSPSSLLDAALPERIAAMLDARGLPASVLILEITEEYLMQDYDLARASLTRLRATGVRISIDDFGTGYSSLAYLRDLPIDELKLDRSFLTPMQDDPRAAALVASTIDLAHSLDLRMVAEGVETADALSELSLYGCDQAQGYFISRPVPGSELVAWLAGRGASFRTEETEEEVHSAP